MLPPMWPKQPLLPAGSRTRVSRLAMAGTLLCGCGLLAGCSGSGGVTIARAASHEAAELAGVRAQAIELTGADVTRLAKKVNVPEDEIRQVAPQLDSQTSWQRTLAAGQGLRRAADDPLGKVAIGVACDGLNGKIRSEQDLETSIFVQGGGLLSQGKALAVRQAAQELYANLVAASQSDDPHLRATVALTCFAVQKAGG